MTTISHIAERSLLRKRAVATRKRKAVSGMLARFRALIAHLGRAIVDQVAPMGYEHETGFCYGNEPVANPRRSRREARN